MIATSVSLQTAPDLQDSASPEHTPGDLAGYFARSQSGEPLQAQDADVGAMLHDLVIRASDHYDCAVRAYANAARRRARGRV